jgi:uncharacterized membrane protein
MRRRVLVLLLAFVFLLPASAATAQETTSRVVRGVVERVEREYADDRGYPQIEMTVRVGDGTVYRVDTADSAAAGMTYDVDPGDRVSVALLQNQDGTETAYFNDAVRTSGLLWAAMAFAAITVCVGLSRGVRALAGLVVTLAILFGGALPGILAGHDPVTVTVLAGIVILAVNMVLTHGWTRETLSAFASASIGLALAWAFGCWLMPAAFLSGQTSDEASILYLEHLGPAADMAGILLAGIILGTVGALDDVAIAQGEIVAELREANQALSRRELFVRSIRVGRHHIASIANTLVLAYAGAALPTFLLFLALPSVTTVDFLNTEAVAEEVVRTLAGTAALILTVPISTWLAVSYGKRGLETD